jgi:hypothetical protein
MASACCCSQSVELRVRRFGLVSLAEHLLIYCFLHCLPLSKRQPGVEGSQVVSLEGFINLLLSQKNKTKQP